MNIVKLEHEQEIEVINAAIRILRQRIVGSVDRIEHIEQEFLATSLGDDMKAFSSISPSASTAEKDEFIKKGKPISLEVMSICRAIQEAVFGLIKKDRPHIEKPTISEDELKALGAKVMGIFNIGKNEKETLPLRFAEVIHQRMRKNEENMSELRHQIDQCFARYLTEKSPEIQSQLFATIREHLSKIHELAEQNREDDARYDLSILEGQTDEEEDDLEKKFKPGNIFDTGGGLLDMDEVVADDNFSLEIEKDIPFSEAEKELIDCLPREIRDDPWIVSNTYYWHTYGEDWQKDGLNMEKQSPGDYIDLLESVLRRKRIIFTHAHQKWSEEKKKQGKGNRNKRLCSRIEEYLPVLHDEIDVLEENIRKRREKIKEKTKVTPKNKLSNLETSFSRLRGKYSRALHNFLDIEGYENYEEVEALEKSLIIAYNDLESYCLKHGQQSHMLGRNREDANTEAAEGVLTIDTYLESPNYFTHFPEALRAPKSEHEKILEMACCITLHPLFRYPQNTSTIELIYQEDDGSESPEIEKMKLIKSIVQSFIERKTAIYFHASKWLEENENEEVQHHKYALEDEILHLDNALQIISRRIRWADDASQKYPELQAEIDYLAQERHKLLWRFILAPSEETQYPLSGRIKELTQAIADRNAEISSGNRQHKTPHSTISAEPLSESEGGSCHYVPISVRKSEKILFGRVIPYFSEKRGSQVQDHSWEKEKQRLYHHLERKMMIYFYARQRISSIDEALINVSHHDAEKLFLEREFIEENIYQLSQEIDNLSEHIKQVNIYSGERCEEQTEEEKIDALAHKAMSLHAELDGIIAHSDDDFGKKVERYWFTLQRYLLRFRTRLMIQKEKGETHKITQIQAEFNQEMHFIILDMQDALDSLQASRKKRERMMNTIQKIRTAVFGHRQDTT